MAWRFLSRLCAPLLWGSALLQLAGGCTATPPPTQRAAIAPPARPLAVPVALREGSFERSHLSPRGVLASFAEELRDARVFAGVAHPAPPDSARGWELELAASDYGEEDAYTLELQALLLRGRELVASYFTKQSLRQRAGTGRELVVGPEQLAELGRQAILELVGQLAADAERLRTEQAEL